MDLRVKGDPINHSHIRREWLRIIVGLEGLIGWFRLFGGVQSYLPSFVVGDELDVVWMEEFERCLPALFTQCWDWKSDTWMGAPYAWLIWRKYWGLWQDVYENRSWKRTYPGGCWCSTTHWHKSTPSIISATPPPTFDSWHTTSLGESWLTLPIKSLVGKTYKIGVENKRKYKSPSFIAKNSIGRRNDTKEVGKWPE